jgi:hypothetical protein
VLAARKLGLQGYLLRKPERVRDLFNKGKLIEELKTDQ